MGLDIYFRRDIANALCAVHIANCGSSNVSDDELPASVQDVSMIDIEQIKRDAYNRGCLNTLRAVGRAFGLRLIKVSFGNKLPEMEWREEVGHG